MYGMPSHGRQIRPHTIKRSAGGPQLPVAQKIYSAIPHARLASLTSERPQAINGLWNAKLLNILTFAMLGSPQVWDMASIFEGTKQTHLPIDP